MGQSMGHESVSWEASSHNCLLQKSLEVPAWPRMELSR